MVTTKRRIARWCAFAAAALICAALLLTSFIWVPALRERLARRSFESSRWKDASENAHGNPVRLRMVDDLLSRFDLVGMKRTDVVDLLGERDDTEYFKSYDMVYWLGPERGVFSIDSEWLVLRVQGDRVIEARVVRD